jgi:hypothetical protein
LVVELDENAPVVPEGQGEGVTAQYFTNVDGSTTAAPAIPPTGGSFDFVAWPDADIVVLLESGVGVGDPEGQAALARSPATGHVGGRRLRRWIRGVCP